MAKRIAVIGAGGSGLPAIKSCLEEGLVPVCYEKTDRLGGLWHYTDTPVDDESCVMKSTVINTSKEIMMYSDYPMPSHFPVYMHNTKVLAYMESYAQQFDLRKHIQFQTEVLKIEESEDFSQTGRWKVSLRERVGAKETTEVFDGVMVCSGHHTDKQLPNFPGLESFRGKLVHTHDYRSHAGYEDKRVVVVGIGNSGGDVAVELSRIAKQAYLSTRRGTWVMNRVFDNGYPADLILIRRVADFVHAKLPRFVYNKVAEFKLNSRFDHSNFNLKPSHSFDAAHPTINDDLPNRLLSGTLLVKPNIKRVTETGVVFEDGSALEDIDVIITATGYKFGFPFIKHPSIRVTKNEVNLYKYVFPPDIRPSTLAVIGCIQPIGAITPISEMQCRWAAKVFKGDAPLPSIDAMKHDIKQKKEAMAKRYVHSERHTIQVEYSPIMDEMAEHIGCKPDFGKMLRNDPYLFYKCYFGPFSPYQYRLFGPGRWGGARQAIMTIWDRTLSPTRSKVKKDTAIPGFIYVLALVIIVLILRVFGVL